MAKKIDLSFDEFIDIVSVLDVWAREIQEADMAEAQKLLNLNAELHLRYSKASVEEELALRAAALDSQLPDSIYAPDPEDFCKDGSLVTSQNIAPCGALRSSCGTSPDCGNYGYCPLFLETADVC